MPNATIDKYAVADILDKAADNLEDTYGWCQSTIANDDGERCSIGAIYYETRNDRYTKWQRNAAFIALATEIYPDYSKDRSQSFSERYNTRTEWWSGNVVDRTRTQLGGVAEDIIVDWNDSLPNKQQMSNSKRKVVAAFRRAARRTRLYGAL